jgi:hypothetical protein
MRKYLITFTFILTAILIVSCSGRDPVMLNPDMGSGNPNRSSAYFSDIVQLFGDDDPAATADISEIIQGPCYQSEAACGKPWEDDNPSGEKWAVAVTRVIRDVGVYGIEYRFVGEDTTSSHISNVLVLVDEDDEPIEGDIRLPKVASCFFNWNETPFVEVTVVFQWREDEEDPWAIRVLRMSFDPDEFDVALNNMSPVVLEDHVIDYGFQYGDIMPDVDYDPRGDKGDLWICYTRWITMNYSENRIFMIEARRWLTG